MGLVVPLAGALVTLTAINVAVAAAPRFHSKGLQNVGVALMSDTTRLHVHAIFQVLAFTIVGCLRFGVAALRRAAPVHWISFVGVIGTIVWYAARPLPTGAEGVLEGCTDFLAAASAILTVNAITRSSEREPKIFDVPATLSLVCGLGIPALIGFWRPETNQQMEEYSWGHPWLLPSYGIAFLAQLTGRGLLSPSLSSSAASKS